MNIWSTAICYQLRMQDNFIKLKRQEVIKHETILELEQRK